MKVEHTLKPIYHKDSKVLILGSIPSVKSRQEKFIGYRDKKEVKEILKKYL